MLALELLPIIGGHPAYLDLYRPRNYKELYNLRHASARNVVERIFGVLKRRFRLMVAAPDVMTTLVTSTCDGQTRIEVGRRWFGVRARDESRQSCQEGEVTSE